MSSRWNSNTVLLAVFLLILVGAGFDYGRRVLGGTKPSSAPEPAKAGKAGSAPEFAVGDPAPDFALPDAKNKVHKLSELVKGKTLLFFACGCQECKQVQTWIANMRDSKKVEVPPIITVTSAPPEAEAAWFRDTGLKQTMLYHKEGVSPDAMTIYKGKPCPRLYVLNADRTVKFIGSSPSDTPGTQAIGLQIVKELNPGGPSDPSGMQMRMMMEKAPKQKPDPKPMKDLPPYAQPQSSFPGGA